MAKRRLLVYLDPGFLENRGHYMNFSKHIHAEAMRRGIEIRHFVNSATSKDYCDIHGLVPVFTRTAYLADSTKYEEASEIIRVIDHGLAQIVASVAAEADKYDEIVYYMYTGHPAYLSSLALQLAHHMHGKTSVTAHVVMFYLSDCFCYGNDDGRYARYLHEVSNQLDALDPNGTIHVGIDSDTALETHAVHFSRPVTVLPFPHVSQTEVPAFPSKHSTRTGRPRITYTGYPHSKYGFHLVLAMLEHSIADPFWANIEFELKLNMRISENELIDRWQSIKCEHKNLHINEGYMEDAEYLAMIGLADVLLIPYGSQYNHDTSAILIDGLLNGCVIIAAEPTWMANVLKKHGSGRVYKAEDTESFIAATRDVIVNLSDYRGRTSHQIAGLPWKFSAEGLFDMLFPRWRTTLTAITPNFKTRTSESVADYVIMPPPQGGANSSRENVMSHEQLMEELTKLKKYLKYFNSEFLPGDKYPLPQRVSDLRAIAAAWADREHYKTRFEELARCQKSNRCVVLGTDISIDPETIQALDDEVVFAPQQTYRQFRATGITPDYLVLESKTFIDNHIDDFQKLHGIIKFVPYHYAHMFLGDADILHFNHQPRKSYPDDYDISMKAQDVTYTSCTVVGTTLQIAMSLGFRQICLLGVDVQAYSEDRSELDKLYAKAAITAKENGIELINVCLNTTVPHINYLDLEPFASTQRRAQAVLAAVSAGNLEQSWSPEEVAIAERVLLNKHPCPSDIYLPTSKYKGVNRVAAIRKVVTAWNDRRDIYQARLHEAKRRMQNKKRCFIIGNGPSLNQTNLDLLKNDVTFATNGIFLKFDETGFRPTFYVVEDHLVGEDRYEEINHLSGFTKLAPYYLAYCLEDGEDVIYYNHRGRKSYPHGFDFSTNAEEITYTGCTVTFSCMQLAFYMGFKEIYLIGVDMSYMIPEQVKKVNEYDTEILDMEVDDPNHFIPNYFGRGYRWHDPNVDKMEQAYIEARKVTEMNGVKIYNATIGGKCEVFDRVDYYTLFDARGIHATSHTRELEGFPLQIPVSNGAERNDSRVDSMLSIGAFSSKVEKFMGSSNNHMTISLAVARDRSKFLVVELGDSVTSETLKDIRVELDGHLIQHSTHLEQLPKFINVPLEQSYGEEPITVTFSWKPMVTDKDQGIYIDSIHVFPRKTFLKGEFPLCYFDGLSYLKENPDVAKAVEERRELSAFSHYISTGRAKGRRFTIATTSLPNYGWRYELINSPISSSH